MATATRDGPESCILANRGSVLYTPIEIESDGVVDETFDVFQLRKLARLVERERSKLVVEIEPSAIIFRALNPAMT